MYDMIKTLYQSGKLTDKGLRAAVSRNWITSEQAEKLMRESDEG